MTRLEKLREMKKRDGKLEGGRQAELEKLEVLESDHTMEMVLKYDMGISGRIHAANPGKSYKLQVLLYIKELEDKLNEWGGGK